MTALPEAEKSFSYYVKYVQSEHRVWLVQYNEMWLCFKSSKLIGWIIKFSGCVMLYNTHGKCSMSVFFWKREKNWKKCHWFDEIDKHNQSYVERRDAEHIRKRKNCVDGYGGWKCNTCGRAAQKKPFLI